MIAFIVFGTTNLTSRKGSGTFLCPTCGTSQNYVEKSVRRFFTLYFIPLVPLDLVGRFVECQNCTGTFNTEVLTLDEETIMQSRSGQFVEHCRRLMILMVLADEKVSQQAINLVNHHALLLGGDPYSDEEMMESIRMARDAEITVAEYAFQIESRLSEAEKREICRCLFLVASVDGDLGEMQQAMLQNLPDSLAISEADFRQVIAEAANER